LAPFLGRKKGGREGEREGRRGMEGGKKSIIFFRNLCRGICYSLGWWNSGNFKRWGLMGCL
jgi:hypothetical protein